MSLPSLRTHAPQSTRGNPFTANGMTVLPSPTYPSGCLTAPHRDVGKVRLSDASVGNVTPQEEVIPWPAEA